MAIVRIAKIRWRFGNRERASPPADGEQRTRGTARRSEEIIPLVIHDDERGEVTYLDLPHRFHPQFGVLEHIDPGDAVLRQLRRGAADRAEVEPAMRLACCRYGGGPV